MEKNTKTSFTPPPNIPRHEKQYRYTDYSLSETNPIKSIPPKPGRKHTKWSSLTTDGSQLGGRVITTGTSRNKTGELNSNQLRLNYTGPFSYQNFHPPWSRMTRQVSGPSVSTQLERDFGGSSLPYLSRCVSPPPSLLLFPRLRAAHSPGRRKKDGPRGLEGEADRDDEDVVKRLYAPCLGSHTSKTKRRTVKGPRGVSPSDREANWYVRLRSLACFAPSFSCPLLPPAPFPLPSPLSGWLVVGPAD